MPTLRDVYDSLLDHHGPQNWWPGDSRFEIMVGAVLTQNTSWSNVEKAIANLKRAKVLTPKAIISAPTEHLVSWLKPSGYFNVKTRRLVAFCQWLLEQGGEVELATRDTAVLREQLLAVHGIGPETADDILLYAFDRPVFVVDAYTRRLFGRLGLVDADASYEELRAQFESSLVTDVGLFNEYHALIVLHGKQVCRPQARCDHCCLNPYCAAAD
jgi:endonuclease-3 related protein